MKRVCIYCGSVATTRDHVPPKAIFPKWRRKLAKPITVPSCASCNEGFSLDDQYFTAALTANWKAGPAAMETWIQTVRPALQTADRQGLKRLLQRSVRPISLVVGGSTLETGIFTPDMNRFQRVITRIVKGLYFSRTGRIIPADYDVSIEYHPDEELKNLALSANVDVVD